MNLLSNAIDALEDSTVHSQTNRNPQITIRTQVTDDQQVVIGIADNGTGIPEEVKKRLFDPFFTTKPVGKGTGLGLSICYQIITEKHGGQINFVSNLGQGSEFIIKIPLQFNIVS